MHMNRLQVSPIVMNTACEQRIKPTWTRCLLDLMAAALYKHNGKAEDL